VWLIKWFLVVAAVGVLFDWAFGDRDRIAAANKAPLEFVARAENFDRPDAETLDFNNAPLFLVPAGSFAIRDGRAVRSSAEDAVALASLPDGKIGAVSMTVLNANTGSGVVFRFRDLANYWVVTPHASHGTWSLVKIQGGVATTMAETASAVGTENVSISVQTDGDRIVVRLNGRMETVLSDAFLGGVASTGFIAKGPEGSEVQFDDFVLYYPASS
jgi:hypothetical protein